MLDLSEKIISKIESKQIRPRPRWQFIAKKYAVFTIGIAALILGSLAFSLVLHLVKNQDWELQTIGRYRFLILIISSLPFVWLIFFISILALIYYNFRQLRKGYKYPTRTIILSSLAITIFFGGLAAILGLNQELHETLNNHLPPSFRAVLDTRRPAWDRPQAGLLAGKIIDLDRSHFTLEDPHLFHWQVQLDDQTVIATETELHLDDQVKIIGLALPPNIFIAQEIRPWERLTLPRHRPPLTPPLN